ncbi:MAG: Uncharacterised protein [Rhodobiaceae bacterium UBA7378]|nr:MAG: Uncharacterised protein [Rhodobiaceae bacterium UBA7378]|tara:strand:- start:306 stop:692 length:387 start_codon:yes stop_codon:yes gene_type:complete
MQFLRMLFTWWHSQTLGTALTTWRHGEFVGMDDQGNRYYRDKNGKSINGKTRRWVVYNGDVEATRVPPEWHGWLHYTVDETPAETGFDKKDWHKPHRANQTGTPNAHKPAGQEDTASHRAGYGSWSPE